MIDGKCVVPQGVAEIPEEMYWGYQFLKELVLPDGLTKIGDKAFFACINASANISFVIPFILISIRNAQIPFLVPATLKSISPK